jgi:hypothetical protein
MVGIAPYGIVDGHRGDEAIALAGNVEEISIALLAVAERAPQCCDMDREIALDDDHVRPDARHEIALGDQFARTLDESDKYVERPTAERHRTLTLEKNTLSWIEAVGTENKTAF